MSKHYLNENLLNRLLNFKMFIINFEVKLLFRKKKFNRSRKKVYGLKYKIWSDLYRFAINGMVGRWNSSSIAMWSGGLRCAWCHNKQAENYRFRLHFETLALCTGPNGVEDFGGNISIAVSQPSLSNAQSNPRFTWYVATRLSRNSFSLFSFVLRLSLWSVFRERKYFMYTTRTIAAEISRETFHKNIYIQ